MVAVMKRTARLTGAMLAVMVATLLVFAAGPSQSASNQSSFNMAGLVQGVSYAQNVVEISVNGTKQSVHITPTTAIDKRGETGSIADIRPGVHILVSGVVRDGQKVALTIEIK